MNINIIVAKPNKMMPLKSQNGFVTGSRSVSRSYSRKSSMGKKLKKDDKGPPEDVVSDSITLRASSV